MAAVDRPPKRNIHQNKKMGADGDELPKHALEAPAKAGVFFFCGITL
jgi:hypothetical protein